MLASRCSSLRSTEHDAVGAGVMQQPVQREADQRAAGVGGDFPELLDRGEILRDASSGPRSCASRSKRPPATTTSGLCLPVSIPPASGLYTVDETPSCLGHRHEFLVEAARDQAVHLLREGGRLVAVASRRSSATGTPARRNIRGPGVADLALADQGLQAHRGILPAWSCSPARAGSRYRDDRFAGAAGCLPPRQDRGLRQAASSGPSPIFMSDLAGNNEVVAPAAHGNVPSMLSARPSW